MLQAARNAKRLKQAAMRFAARHQNVTFKIRPMKRGDKATSNRILLRASVLLILLFSSSMSILGQTQESDRLNSTAIPDQAMEQIVRRVLAWYFKPRTRQKVIFLDGPGLQKSWFPSIENIEFRFVADEDRQQVVNGVYFFTEPERYGNRYQIGFAFGSPGCEYLGDLWHFRISKQRIRLWRDKDVGIGGNCSWEAGAPRY
jgi:hypothetical protein